MAGCNPSPAPTLILAPSSTSFRLPSSTPVVHFSGVDELDRNTATLFGHEDVTLAAASARLAFFSYGIDAEHTH